MDTTSTVERVGATKFTAVAGSGNRRAHGSIPASHRTAPGAVHEAGLLTFARLSAHYAEREMCEIVWLVASEHLYNMTNIGLNIHADMLCDVHRKKA